MELLFLGILMLLMIMALTSGYPVAFALPGSAIIAIGLAALTGYVLEGSTDVYFVGGDGPLQWLSAGVTNFRSLYWVVERDTLIAIPLFIFMGIILQRSKIAEDLLVAMAQLFGPMPGGLGISVVIVGALLAATTGIVGATVIAMGLISLPAMLRNNYSKPLATGVICASGTLGQIIPPSIVLIILADQLTNATEQANTARKELYKTMTGEYSMPSQFEVASASAGDMFMGAIVPGLVLVGIYIAYIFIVAWLKPEKAPPVPYDGAYDAKFARTVFLALVPPLTLILVVLGSIILGVATVNQAGSIGAIGAILMASYRLHTGAKLTTFVPIGIALVAIITIAVLTSSYDLNIKNIENEAQRSALTLAGIAVGFLLLAVTWASWRVYRIDNILKEVMIETAKTTSMVFIILIGAAMLTAAFRAFGGEELVKHALTGLPGGFWTQFLVVMLVIFLLGFFLDFIEIAVVVVPIVAPILLMNPEANITAVWLGVMIGLNIQTSFLTPPFGFALFYLRGVADKVVKTLDIYKGAAAFITLQLLALAIAGLYPSLINYLPNRTHLLSDTAPPPINPKLQVCVQEYTLEQLDSDASTLQASIANMQKLDVSYLPDKLQDNFKASNEGLSKGFELILQVQAAQTKLDEFNQTYSPLHHQVRAIQTAIKQAENQIDAYQNDIKRQRFNPNSTDAETEQLEQAIKQLEADKVTLEATVPAEWDEQHKAFKVHNDVVIKAQREYDNTVDAAYQQLRTLVQTLESSEALQALSADISALAEPIKTAAAEEAMTKIEAVEAALGDLEGASAIKSSLSKARRELKKDDSAEIRVKAGELLQTAETTLAEGAAWRERANKELLPQLQAHHELVLPSFGVRSQARFSESQAKQIAACLSHHKDVSLNF